MEWDGDKPSNLGGSKGLPSRGGSLAQLVDREGTTVGRTNNKAPSSTLSAALRGLQKLAVDKAMSARARSQPYLSCRL